ncbi:MAG: response regulator transcription factor [Oscillospiraceae bacterium]|nr:response regulator transcription factor [Oscillospiraceae bacterium]
MYNILIYDDEKDIVNALKIYLSDENYTTFTAYNGKQALDIIRNNEIHLALMDIMMPQMDGIEALSAIREEYNIPVILLSAKSEDTDKILGLNMGADDYITKPFNPVELQARVKSRLRRYTKLGGKVLDDGKITIGGITLDDKTKNVTCDGEEVNLTPTEFEILRLLMHNPGRVFSPKEIYAKVWNDAPYGAENTVVVHIRHLREKLEINPAEPRYLKVVWGHGYKMENGK